jgi:flagellar biosynthesis/type III secretory pathway protein FliH
MVEAKQFREILVLDENLVSLKVSYDGKPRIDADEHARVVDEAYRKGYDESSSQHKQQILDFRSEVNALREKTFSDLETKFSGILCEAREALKTLTFNCVTKTLGGLEVNAAIVSSIVDSVIKESGLDDEKMEIRLNPEDLSLLEGLQAELRSKHPRLEFVADGNLDRGDCLLSSRFGKVDGLLSTKLERLKKGLGSNR